MKDWIKNLSGDDIKDAYDHFIPPKVSEKTENLILNRIYSQKHILKQSIFKRYRFQFAFSGAAAFIIILIPLLILFNPQESSLLQLTRIENTVIFEKDNMPLQLQEKNFIDKGTRIKTDLSTCELSYGKNSSISCLFHSDIVFAGKTNRQINLELKQGKLLVSESRNLFDFNLSITTELANIRATGTKYRVEYLNDSLLVAVDEGTVLVDRKDLSESTQVKAHEEIIIHRNGKKKIFYEKRNWQLQQIAKLSEKIVTFVSDNERVYGLTENQRIAFSYTGEILWKTNNEYPLHSTPMVDQNHLLIPVDHRILDIDPRSGKLKLDLRTVESLFGYHAPVVKDNMLYLAYSSGLWTYDLVKQKDDFRIFTIMGSTPPVFYADTLYSSSYLTKTLEAFSMQGKQVWTVPIYEGSYHRPVLADNSLIVTVWGGIIKKYNLTGKWLMQTKVKADIVSLVQCDDSLFFLDESNHLSIIEPENLDIDRIIPDVSAFTAEDRQKFVTANGNQISIYRNENPDVLTAPAAISAVHGIFYGNRYFLGLEDGTIFIMEAK
ncbi:MAG: PQQ-binding-like beta-propeller repeat protein [Chitinivibrionales bacterium]|nr:PQQ-binding-like beta-propeller repeat protein [Chitinivibrionales bacterium]